MVAGLTPTRPASPRTELPRAARSWRTASSVFGAAATGTNAPFITMNICSQG
jgi:hypothetical protein